MSTSASDLTPDERLPHGDANRTVRHGDEVVKQYVGAGAHERFQRERWCLAALAGALPVATVTSEDEVAPSLTMRFVGGRHAPDLLTVDCSDAICRCLGGVLRRIHNIDRGLFGDSLPGSGGCLVHGDFGLPNIIFSVSGLSVALLADWEWAHVGSAVEDLAWAEWTVRYYHPGATQGIPELFHGYGSSPSWPERHCAMMKTCQQRLDFAESSGDQAAAAEWRQRQARTMHFSEPC